MDDVNPPQPRFSPDTSMKESTPSPDRIQRDLSPSDFKEWQGDPQLPRILDPFTTVFRERVLQYLNHYDSTHFAANRQDMICVNEEQLRPRRRTESASARRKAEKHDAPARQQLPQTNVSRRSNRPQLNRLRRNNQLQPRREGKEGEHATSKQNQGSGSASNAPTTATITPLTSLMRVFHESMRKRCCIVRVRPFRKRILWTFDLWYHSRASTLCIPISKTGALPTTTCLWIGHSQYETCSMNA